MKTIHKLFTIVLLVIVAGCSSTGRPIATDNVAAIERGRTTQAEVKQLLGEPQTVTTQGDGLTVWQYQHTRATAKGRSFIPYVGPLVAGANVRHEAVTVTFDSSGIVSDITHTKGQDEVKTNLSTGSGKAR